MVIEIKIPSPGESVNEVEISQWLVSEGDYVEKDQELAEIESDKVTLPLIAEESGTISIKAQPGKSVPVGFIACTIDTRVKSAPSQNGKSEKRIPEDSDSTVIPKTNKREEVDYGNLRISPLARRLMEDKELSVEDVLNGLIRISKEDVEMIERLKKDKELQPAARIKDSGSTREKTEEKSRKTKRSGMSMLRRNLSSRLLSVQTETAMLTTFNEVDMSRIIGLRKKYRSEFIDKHEVKLGLMSFFTKAVSESLNQFPLVNSFIDNDEIVTPEYHDIGIAVQTGKGLMVPVIRNAETLGLADIERKIIELAEKAKNNRISIEEIKGGTFTITNGGIFGSLLSTPILNPPQSGILGMHNIVDRPVAVNGKVEIRPMMYIALSYDHRLIDGRDSVKFLLKVKETLEDPVKILFNGKDPGSVLLDL